MDAIVSDAEVKPLSSEKAKPYRWLILMTAWFGYLLSFVSRLLWTSVGSSASESFGLSLAALGLFVSAFYVGYIASTALAGLGTDRFGPRLMLTCSLIPLGILTFLFGFTSSVVPGIIFQALMGLMAGADFSSGIKLIIAWFHRNERGRAMGLFMTATSLGLVVTNLIAPRLLEFIDWRHVYHVVGIFTIVYGLFCYAVVRDNPNGDKINPVNWRQIRSLARNRQYVLAVIAGVGGTWGAWGFGIWSNALMTKGLQFSPIVAGSIVASFGVIAVISKPLIGLLSDMLGGRRRTIVMVDLFMFSGLLSLTAFLTTEAQFWIVVPLMGVTAFSFSPLQNAMAAEAGGEAAGSAAGISVAIDSISVSLVPLVIGYVFSSTGSYAVAFAVLAVGPLIGALAMIPARDSAGR